MKNITLISLARAVDRKEFMINQFSKSGIPYQSIDAIDGQDQKSISQCEVDFEAYKKIYSKEIKPGEIGCYQSHLKALELICGSSNDYGIVMEDDVLIKNWHGLSSVSEAISETINSIQDNWDLIYPGNPLMWSGHEYESLCYKDVSQSRLNQDYQFYKPEKLRKALLGTQCYIISVEFAYYILKHWNTIYRPIDEVYRYLCANDGRRNFYHAARKNWWCHPNFNVKSEIAI